VKMKDNNPIASLFRVRQPGGMVLTALFLVFGSIFLSGCENRYQSLNLGIYQYRDTKELVRFVYDASQKLKKEGLKSLDYFRDNRSRYRTSESYLYIYNIQGVNIFNAGMPHLEGKSLRDLTDKNGKKPLAMMEAALADKNNPHAWIHFSWWEPGKFYPVPKSSCHFKVITPEGKEFIVGGGLNYPLEEKEFIRIAVDDAVQLIGEKGEAAFSTIENPASSFNFRDVKVFVFTPTGKLIISPVMNDHLADINLLDCEDEMGHKPFKKALLELKTKDRTWEVFLARDRYQRSLIKKTLYLRKMKLAGEALFVGAITDLPQPPA
jgi:hypothetical protein